MAKFDTECLVARQPVTAGVNNIFVNAIFRQAIYLFINLFCLSLDKSALAELFLAKLPKS